MELDAVDAPGGCAAEVRAVLVPALTLLAVVYFEQHILQLQVTVDHLPAAAAAATPSGSSVGKQWQQEACRCAGICVCSA
jgi:hypothetical protein